MSIALALQPPDVTPPSTAFVEFVAAIGDFEAPVREAVASAEAALARGETQLNRATTNLQALVGVARDFIARGGELGSKLDELVTQAEHLEDEIARDDASVRKVIQRLRSLLRRTNPELAAAVEAPIGRYEEITDRYRAALQDIRWQLMALRAETRRGETGPIFSDPGELKRHLRSRPH